MAKLDPAGLANVRLAIASVLTAALVVRRPPLLDLALDGGQQQLVDQAFSMADKLIAGSPPQTDD